MGDEGGTRPTRCRGTILTETRARHCVRVRCQRPGRRSSSQKRMATNKPPARPETDNGSTGRNSCSSCKSSASTKRIDSLISISGSRGHRSTFQCMSTGAAPMQVPQAARLRSGSGPPQMFFHQARTGWICSSAVRWTRPGCGPWDQLNTSGGVAASASSSTPTSAREDAIAPFATSHTRASTGRRSACPGGSIVSVWRPCCWKVSATIQTHWPRWSRQPRTKAHTLRGPSVVFSRSSAALPMWHPWPTGTQRLRDTGRPWHEDLRVMRLDSRPTDSPRPRSQLDRVRHMRACRRICRRPSAQPLGACIWPCMRDFARAQPPRRPSPTRQRWGEGSLLSSVAMRP